jgi:hypothetical protein
MIRLSAATPRRRDAWVAFIVGYRVIVLKG